MGDAITRVDYGILEDEITEAGDTLDPRTA